MEKASQLRYDAPAIPRLNIPAYNWWNEALHGVARAGTATVFPQAIGMAATFDENLLRNAGKVITTEGRAKYNAASALNDRDIYKGLTFWAPNVNIFRDPRWGRGHRPMGRALSDQSSWSVLYRRSTGRWRHYGCRCMCQNTLPYTPIPRLYGMNLTSRQTRKICAKHISRI